MKRLVALAIGSTLIMTAQAQKQNVSFGPTAGFGHAWFSNTANSKYHPAGNVGVNLTYSSSPHWGLGGDIKFSIEGNETSSGNTTVTNRLDYVRVPLRVLYFFGDYGDRLRPKLAAGPSFGFLVGGKRETEVNNATTTAKASDFYDGFDVGLGAQAGLNYRLVRNTWLAADVNYYHGFSDITKATATNVKNRNIGINLGLNFGIGTAR